MMVLLLLTMMSCSERKESIGKAPTRVKIETVSTAAAASSATTYVGVVQEREATAVSFTGMGVVRRVTVSEGQAVRRGQLLAEMDDTQARSLLRVAEAQVAQAEDALQRYGLLHDAGSLPEVQWVEVQSKVAQARSSLDVAKKNLSDCRLVAPVSGIIGKKMIGVGETALPSQAVVTILDISSVKVKVAVPETEVAAISPNTPSRITVEAAGVETGGGAIEKGVVADALTHTYDLFVNVSNRDGQLLPGMVASVRFAAVAQQQAGQTLLPVSAVQRRADGSLFVWTVGNDSTAHRMPVSVGPTQGNRIVVSSGIEDGQRVVTEGYQKLSEGVHVVY